MLIVLGRLRPWEWTKPAAVAVVAIGLGVVVVMALVLRVSMPVAARAADRGLVTRDAFATALEVHADVDGFGARVHQRAADLATGQSPRDAVPLRPSWRWWAVAGVLFAGAIGFSMTCAAA